MYRIICKDTHKNFIINSLKRWIILDFNATQIYPVHVKQMQASLLTELILFRRKPNKSLLPFVMHVGVWCWLIHQEAHKQMFCF